MYRNILLKLEYDGSGFHGWQFQNGLRTVQGELETALSRVCRKELKVSGTSRTDAGVHALGQCCSFKADIGIPSDKLPLAVNHMLAGGRYGAGSAVPDIRVLSAEEKPLDFHARFDCKGKTYIYRMSTAEPDVFNRNFRYFLDAPEVEIDVEAMNKAAALFVGKHDFRCFQAAGGQERETTVRTIFDAGVERNGNDITFRVTGDGFLYNMVRIMTGTLVEIGLGRKAAGSVPDIIAEGDRRLAGHTAPPQGLYLAKIYFDELGFEEFGKETYHE